MIVALAALALQVQEPITAEDFGRTVFMAGVCGGIGFELDRPALFAMGGAAADADPDPDAWMARSRHAVDALEAELGEEAAAVIADGDAAAARAWTRRMVDRCDALARAHPGMVLRSAEAEPRIQEWLTSFDVR